MSMSLLFPIPAGHFVMTTHVLIKAEDASAAERDASTQDKWSVMHLWSKADIVPA